MPTSPDRDPLIEPEPVVTGDYLDSLVMQVLTAEESEQVALPDAFFALDRIRVRANDDFELLLERYRGTPIHVHRSLLYGDWPPELISEPLLRPTEDERVRVMARYTADLYGDPRPFLGDPRPYPVTRNRSIPAEPVEDADGYIDGDLTHGWGNACAPCVSLPYPWDEIREETDRIEAEKKATLIDRITALIGE